MLFLCTTLFLAPLPQSTLSSVEPSIAAGDRTRVLVLGTSHLDHMEGFEREMLEPLLERLVAFAPDAVCVESLSGRAIQTMLALAPVYDDVLASFAPEALRWGRVVQEELELDGWAAQRRVAELLDGVREVSDESRDDALLDLCLHFLAAYEPGSAALTWLGLPPAFRSAALLPEGVGAFLTGWSSRRNEVASLALPLAERLGLDRLDAIDDHADKDDYLRIASQLSAELQASPELAGAQQAEVFREVAALEAAGVAAGDLLPLYRFTNSADFGRRDVEAQWDVFLRTRLESGNDRRRLGLWDVRNLGIAANVRRVSARHPGGRVLVIIGASHKSFLDAILATGLDVEVVDAGSVLGDGDERPR